LTLKGEDKIFTALSSEVKEHVSAFIIPSCKRYIQMGVDQILNLEPPLYDFVGGVMLAIKTT